MNTLRIKKTGRGAMRLSFAIFTALTFLVVSCVGGFASERNFSDHSNSTLYNETQDDMITIVLVGVADYEVTEIFNDIINQTPAVLESKRVRLHIDPNRPKACYATWSVRMASQNLFELESEIYERIKDVAGRNPEAPAVTFSFVPTDKNLETLGFIRPWESTSNEIAFLLHRPLPHELKHANSKFTRHGYRPFGYHPQTWHDRGFE